MKILRWLAAALLLGAAQAHAAYTVYLYQSGPDVVASGSGTINTAGLAFGGAGGSTTGVFPAVGQLITGNAAAIQVFTGVAGPAAFGGGGGGATTGVAGNGVGVSGAGNLLLVPNPYVSGAPLASSATWAGTTLAALGATPGTYVWTWAGDSFTLVVGTAPVAVAAPIPSLSEWAMALLVLALVAFAAGRMKGGRTF